MDEVEEQISKKDSPNDPNIRSFRINQQFRAIGYFNEENDLIITMIDDHA